MLRDDTTVVADDLLVRMGVAAGDTLPSISQKVYGDANQWRRIYDANKDAIGNNPNLIKVGVKLTIPPKESQ